jgi:hypothetical protein
MENIRESKPLNDIHTTLSIYFNYCFHIPYFDCLTLNGKVLGVFFCANIFITRSKCVVNLFSTYSSQNS